MASWINWQGKIAVLARDNLEAGAVVAVQRKDGTNGVATIKAKIRSIEDNLAIYSVEDSA